MESRLRQSVDVGTLLRRKQEAALQVKNHETLVKGVEITSTPLRQITVLTRRKLMRSFSQTFTIDS